MMAVYGYYNQLQINFTENSGLPSTWVDFINNSMFIKQSLSLLVKSAMME